MASSLPASLPASEPALDLSKCLWQPKDPEHPMMGPYETTRDCLVQYAIQDTVRKANWQLELDDARMQAKIYKDDAESTHAQLNLAKMAAWVGLPALLSAFGGVVAIILTNKK
jgi:hypothetical protein